MRWPDRAAAGWCGWEAEVADGHDDVLRATVSTVLQETSVWISEDTALQDVLKS